MRFSSEARKAIAEGQRRSAARRKQVIENHGKALKLVRDFRSRNEKDAPQQGENKAVIALCTTIESELTRGIETQERSAT